MAFICRGKDRQMLVSSCKEERVIELKGGERSWKRESNEKAQTCINTAL